MRAVPKVRRVWSACAIAILLVCQPLSASASASPVLSAHQRQEIRAVVQRTMQEQHAPGATFSIGFNGRIVWSEGFGYADIENQVKAQPETRYRTASIGKPMT